MVCFFEGGGERGGHSDGSWYPSRKGLGDGLAFGLRLVSISSPECCVLFASASWYWLRMCSGVQLNCWPACDVDLLF